MSNWPNRNSPRQHWTEEHLCIDGYTYTFDSYGKKSVKRISYRCIHGSRNSKNYCPAILKIELTSDNEIKYYLKKQHTCQGCETTQSPFYSVHEIQSKICELYNNPKYNYLPDQIYNDLIEWINSTTPVDKIKNVVSQTFVRNYVQNLSRINSNNIVSFERCLTYDGNKLLLFMASIDNKPIYGFASPFMIQRVSECKIIGIDGTFRTSPQSSIQVCVFIGRTSVMNFPLLYLVLPDKKQSTYECAFNNYKSALIGYNINFNENVKFICDFESAEINAIKNIFIDENKSIQLCYFHYCKALKTKLSIFQKNEKCSYSYYLFKVLQILPFININYVKAFITKVLPKISNVSRVSKKFIHYFITTYNSRFKIEDWNVTGKILRDRATNNSNESFNKKLNANLYKNPSIMQFYNELKNLERDYRNRYENLKLDETKISSSFFDEIKHNEENHLEHYIKILSNKYPFISDVLLEANLMQYGFSDFHDIKISIPRI